MSGKLIRSGLAVLGEALAPKVAKEAPKIRAYHGSPHDFDKFELSPRTIGTGEGAQAYGHGLYFAEKEGIARGYRDALSKVSDNDSLNDVVRYWLDEAKGDRGKAAALYRDYAKSIGLDPADTAQTSQMIEKMPGRLYEVDLNAPPERFLDWDKPLSQQSEAVREVAAPMAEKIKRSSMLLNRRLGEDPTGSSIYQGAISPFGGRAVGITGNWSSKAPIAEKLREAGIPGIQYLDAGSRAAGEGTRNYVVFDPEIITILRKYGLVPPLAAPPALGLMQGEEE